MKKTLTILLGCMFAFFTSSLTNLPSEPAIDPPCDVIVLKTGEEISAKIIKVSETEVQYKKCGDPSGITYTADKANVSVVKYASANKRTASAENRKGPKPVEPNSRAAFWFTVGPIVISIFGLFAFILFSFLFTSFTASLGLLVIIASFVFGAVVIIAFILALIYGIKGMIAFDTNPEKFRGKGYLITAMIILSLQLALVSYGIIPIVGWLIYLIIRSANKNKK